MTRVLLFAFLLASFSNYANNIDVTNVRTTGQNLGSDFTLVEFDVTWDNSWRTATGPSNWDAVWVFVKYKIEGGAGCTPGDWEHATLNTSGHTAPAGSTIDTSSDGVGAFVYRSANGTGTNTWTDLQLRWNYGVDGLLDACEVTIKVFAVEMVYVPTGNFFLGSGGTEQGEFEDATSGMPFQVTSDGSLTLGGGTAGSMGNYNATGQSGGADDFNDGASQTLLAVFPLGYTAFYAMKYEITNEQYAEFLNTLTATQQANKASTVIAGNFHGNLATVQTRAGLKCRIAPSGGVAGLYGVDLDDNDTYNEVATDGLNIALGRISWPDVAGYMDWAGLRPFSETEMEKLARGNQLPVPNEYAWGTASIHAVAYTLSNSGNESEVPSNPSSSTTAGNAIYSTTIASVGPTRVGLFATGSSGRVVSGASYYGAMEMTGNLWELAVSLGSVAGRSFTGVHGDGSLNTSGHADVDFWPGINGNNTTTIANTAYLGTTGVTGRAGEGFHMGAYDNTAWLRTSDREYTQWTGLTSRDRRIGGRGVRSAP